MNEQPNNSPQGSAPTNEPTPTVPQPNNQAQTVAQPPKPKSGLAIAGLVLGIIALLTSFIPIVNNASFFIALLGLIFAIVGIVSTGAKGKRSGRGLAIAALVICLVSGIVVLATQSMYSSAINKVTNGAQVTNTSSASGTASNNSSSASSSSSAASELSVGQSASLDNGLTVTVKEIKTVTSYDGSTLVAALVEYANSGSQGASYNTYDWKGETSSGSQEYTTYYSNTNNPDPTLSSGTLAAGGTVSGWVYFKTGTTKALYFSSIASNKPSATWVLS